MSSSNESNNNSGDNVNNTSTSNIFGSSTKSSISSLFGSSPGLNPSEHSGESSSSDPTSLTSNISSSKNFGSTEFTQEDAYDMFGTTDDTKTKVLAGKCDGNDVQLPVTSETKPSVSLFTPQKLDTSSLFKTGEENTTSVFGSSNQFLSSVSYDPAKTTGIFADTHLAKVPEPSPPPTHRDPPMLHHQEKPKDLPHLDLNTASDNDYGDGYDSNLYSVDDGLQSNVRQTQEVSGMFEQDKGGSLFSPSGPLKDPTEMFGTNLKPVKSLENFGLGSTTAPTFNLVENEQTFKVTESSLSSKTDSLVEPLESKHSLFGNLEAQKTNLFDELSKAPSYTPLDSSKTGPASGSRSLFASTDLTATEKPTDLLGVVTQATSSLSDRSNDTFGPTGQPSVPLSRTGSGTNLTGSATKPENMFGTTSAGNLFTATQTGSSANLFGTGSVGSTGLTSSLFGTTDTSGVTSVPGTSSLFGTTDTKGSLFSTTEKPTTSLFAPAGKVSTTNLFGSPDSTTTTTGTGLFGSTSTTGTTTAKTAGTGLFGTADSTTTTAVTGLFGKKDDVPTTSLFGKTETTVTTSVPGTSSLFGAKDTTTSVPPATSLLGSTDKQSTSNIFTTTDTTTPGAVFGSTDTGAGATASVGLFGTSDKPSTTTSGTGLFGTTDTSGTTAPSTGLFGTSEPTKQPSFGVDTTSKPSEVFSTAEPLKAQDTAPKVTFNLPSEKPAEPSLPTVGTGLAGQPAGFPSYQDTTKLDVDFSLTEQHTIAELLESWEKRVTRKVETFNMFADKVATIDRHIVQQCNNMNNLMKMHQELLEKHRRMESSIKTMEEEQKMALSVLDNMEKVLKGKLEALNNRSNGYNMVQAITRNLQELSDQLSTTTKVAEDTAEACQPEPLYTIAKVLSFHQVSLIDLEKQCDEIDNKIKALELM